MVHHSSELDERLAAAVDAARAAGTVLADGAGGSHAVQTKSADTDLLTDRDLQAEAAALGILQSRFPEDGFLAEESGLLAASDRTWFIDPLDGTTNFAHGIPFFSVSIAFGDASGVLLGVVFDPLRDELFQAVRARGATLNGQPISVSDTPDLNHSLLTTGFPYNVRTTDADNLDHYARLARLTRGVRRLGSAALDLAYVAAGRFDGYWELRTFPWDVAAGTLLVTEAGGSVSPLTGDTLAPFEDASPVSVVATNGRIHSALLSALHANDDRP